MGLTIFYSATLREYDHIDELTVEVKSICSDIGWKYKLVDSKKLKGIVILPENCEPFYLTFLADGRLSGIPGMSDDIQHESKIFAFTKTQFAGPDTHIAQLKLLQCLNEKYFSEIEVFDEGLYWGKWDKKILLDQFTRYTEAMDILSSVLTGMKTSPKDDLNIFTEAVENAVRKSLDEKNDKHGTLS